MSDKVRPITPVDRMLAFGDKLHREVAESLKGRRRTTITAGQLTAVVVELAGEPTTVFLTNGPEDAAIVEATATELSEVAAGVRKLLSDPPPRRRRPR